MAHSDKPPGGGGTDGGTGGPAQRVEIDWMAAENSPEFKDLIKRKRAFVLPATIFFLAWYLGFILLAGLAPDFMGGSIYEGFTVGYLLALTQFVMTWVLSAMYLRVADREFDPLAKRAAEAALSAGRARGAEGAGGRAGAGSGHGAPAAPIAGGGEVAPR